MAGFSRSRKAYVTLRNSPPLLCADRLTRLTVLLHAVAVARCNIRGIGARQQGLVVSRP
jgi:hypothetical protein